MEVFFMKKLFYPAIFHFAEEGGFWISFPDFPECFSQGDNMQQAYEMASDALGLAIISLLDEQSPLPLPTEPYKIRTIEKEICVIIEFDLLAYKKRTNSKAVKKTLSIPEWLNEEAMSANLNFSQILQEALKEHLNLN